MLSAKQNEYIRSANARWNMKVGAVRSGKTYLDIDYMIPARLRAVAGLPGLNVILGVSRESIERNVLQPMRAKFTDRLVGQINSRNIAKVCGEEVYCLGAEKVSQVSKIQGMSIKYCYGDEIAKWSKEVFAMLQSRLDREYSRFDGSCNPEHPGHWLKAFIDKEDVDSYVQKYTLFDNPFLPKSFIENLCTEYSGTVYYKRYILGEWALAEGLIYPMYEGALAEPPENASPTDYRLSIDYGTLNAFAALLWANYGGVWYAVDGYYYSGRDVGITKTDEEYGQDLDELVRPIMEKREQAAPFRKLKTIIDPSAASFIALLQKRRWYAVIPADNAVSDGIRDTAVCMQAGIIKIDPKIEEWREEVEGYVWDEDEQEDRPIKVNDHYMDATRYFVKTENLALRRRR